MPAIVHFREHPPLLKCAGEEDRATQALRRPALARAFTADGDLTVDLADLSFADASLFLDLAVLAQRLRRGGRRVVLRRPQPQIERLLEMMGLDRMPGVRVVGSAAAA